jgi:hypothetical protein
MSRSIRQVSLSAVSFAMLGLALVACGDDEGTDPATSIDSTEPSSQYRIDQDRPYEEIVVRVESPEARPVRRLGASRIDPAPALESTILPRPGDPQ